MKSLCQTQQNLMRSIDSSTHSKVSYFTETFCPEFRPWVNKTGKTFLCIIQKFDSHDMLIPTDQQSWSLLKLARKSLPVEVLTRVRSLSIFQEYLYLQPREQKLRNRLNTAHRLPYRTQELLLPAAFKNS